jgi:hypothetical protein
LEVGSRPFLQGRIEDLADIYARIGEELASQYTLGSISRNPKRDGARRRVIVQEAPSGFEPEKEVLPFGLCSGVYAQKQVDPSKIGRFRPLATTAGEAYSGIASAVGARS